MPIHMERDPNQGNNQNENRGSRRRGRSALTSLLPLILGLVGRKPKLIIPIIVIGAIFYFMGGSDLLQSPATPDLNSLAMGCSMKEEIYDKAQVFEPLANNRKNPLPESISLLKYAPKRMNQGKQGSCVGWASAYAARSILHSRATNENPNSSAFSPAFLYNQIALSGCQGSYLRNAMQAMKQVGALPFSKFRYDESSCAKKPNSQERASAQNYRINGFNRLTLGGNNYKTDMLAIKQNLAQGAPVVIGMQVGGSFMRGMYGKSIWRPSRNDYNQRGFSGHAMCVIGYDDYKNGGSFEIMNSWGPEWGSDGVGWVSYKDFNIFVKEAYGLYPMGNANSPDRNKLAVKFGLVDYTTKRNIDLSQVGNNTFRTKSPIKKGGKFKIEVTNSIDCYTYVFGEDTDGSSYVLFPYTEKHSPYCGITGTRLFPKDYSMKADAVGNRDRIAVVVSKKPIDYKQLNTIINRAQGKNYSTKINTALAQQAIPNIQFKSGTTVDFLATTNAGKNVVGVVIEVDKQ